MKKYNDESRQQVTPISKAWREDIRKAVDIMWKGGIILYPTDTIWGIGCDATNEDAVRRVYEIKQRIDSKALICLTDNDAKLPYYVKDVPPIAWDLLELSVKPLTLVLDQARNLAPNLLAEDGSVGIRITKEPFSKELCFRMRKMIVSTSANISGQPAPRCFDEISDTLKQSVDYICTSRRNERNPAASSVIRLRSNGEVCVIRQ
ncbi:MAG: threonylcarbamoyl-AMP synthase [Alloprevotella sp.]|nr:threonylcarbamoyl-AMP synthase [Alloprevotella sp.]